jgi:outer membrane protein assembly factor BamB
VASVVRGACLASLLIVTFLVACSGQRGSSVLPSVQAPTHKGHGHHRHHRRPHAGTGYAGVVLGDNPTGYYRLDDTGSVAADSSGNGYNGVVGSSLQEGAAGLIAGGDTAMTFPGSTTTAGVVSFSEIAAMEPKSNVSLEAWLEFTAAPKIYTTLVAYGSDRGYAPYSLFFHAGGAIVAQFYTTAGVLEVPAPTALVANKAYHIVSTFDGTTGKLYVNGLLAASGTKAGTLTGYIPGYGFSIGDDAQLADPEFAGTIDEVAVYDGQTLTATQVANHYSAGTTGTGPTPTPSPTPTPAPTATPVPTPTPVGGGVYPNVVTGDAPTAYYHLDDSGTKAADASGHGLNGSIGSSVILGANSLLPAYSDSAATLPGTATAAGVISVPKTSLLQPASAVSLEAWLKFATTPATYTFVTGYGSDTSYAPYGLFFRTGGTIVAQFYLSAGVLEVRSSTALVPNTTYYVAATYDGTTGRIYVNGVQTGSAASTGTFKNYAPGYGFSMGDDAALSDPAFKGTLDEVAVYAGKALSATQIQNHYAAGTSGVAPTPSPTPAPASWNTFGFDLQRTGYNPGETVVGPGNVGSLQQVWSFNVGSGTVHEPVYAGGVNVNGTSTNILYAGSLWGATMYAINAATGAVVWQDAVPSQTYNCGGTSSSQFSIGETPAIDRAKKLLYFADGHNQVHAVDLASGKEATGWPITIADYTPDQNFMHGGLTYNPANGMLYAVTGSTCDISPWYGRVVAIDTSIPGVAGTFFTMSGTSTQGASGGGIWGPGGASIDTANNVYVLTGNADTTNGAPQNATYAEQVVELSPTLGTVIANNYPTNIPTGPGFDDFDFGATPLLFQPSGCPPLVAGVNKSGMFELWDVSTIGSGPVQYVPMSIESDEGSFRGVPAYDPATGYVYVGMPATMGNYKPGLAAFSMASNCTLNTTPAWSASFGPSATADIQQPRSPISIANGVVYVSNYTGDTEYAFNASSGAQLWSFTLSSWGNVGTVIVNGMVYVGAADGTITAWAPPAQAQILRRHVRKNKHSGVHHHRFAPRSPWAQWK